MNVYCQKCQSAAAVVHVTELKGGKKIERHLCEECAEAQEGVPPKAGSSVSMLQIFQQFVEKSGAGQKARDQGCEGGMTFSEFKAKGRFGCAEDYDLFLPRLLPLLQRIHGSTEHLQEGEDAERAAAGRESREELQRLRRDMRQAITDEAYEDAAQLRDKIQELEVREKGGAEES